MVKKKQMKYILLVSVLFFMCCIEEKKAPTFYDSLDTAIMDSVLAKGRKNSNILMYPTHKNSVYFVLQSTPVFMQLIKTHFHVADTSSLKKLLLNSVPLDTTVRTKVSPHIIFVQETSSTEKMQMLRNGRNGESVIDVFYKLVTKDGGKCIVLIHWVDNGAETAVLEKKDGKWRVVSVQTEFLE
jgi:hypothetical protein